MSMIKWTCSHTPQFDWTSHSSAKSFLAESPLQGGIEQTRLRGLCGQRRKKRLLGSVLPLLSNSPDLSHSQLPVLFLLTVLNFSIFGYKEYNRSDLVWEYVCF